MKNPYSVLHIDTHADPKTIKNAFRKLAKQYHPDLNNGSRDTEQKFIEITEAYNILSDPKTKKEVDNILNNTNAYNSTDFNFDYNYNPKYTAQDIDFLIKLFHQQAAPYKKQAIIVLLKGLFWLVLGILITWISYAVASHVGGIYFVFYGAMVFGGWQAVKALYAYFKICGVIKDFENKIWSKL
ncbi:MAG: J domain-containing protein [Ruminococcaceae bacterium]|nr:J domain-containing protein [Oscillospiraceae bacterium]